MTQTANTLAMNTLRFDENCFIRSLVHDGKIYLSSRDICAALDYSNISQALTKSCSPEYIVELQNIAKDPMDIQQISMAEVEGETAYADLPRRQATKVNCKILQKIPWISNR